jgi:phosphoribosylanthranilate isomerase
MGNRIKIKVCGIKLLSDRLRLEQLPVDYLGFIFYPGSKRYVGNLPEEGLFDSGKKMVGVFVDESIEKILEITIRYNIKFVQLHGKEDTETCQKLRDKGLTVIKAFNLHEGFDFDNLKRYEKAADFFLFDTKSGLPGGSGEKFNWKILERYNGRVPFFLSGGIGPADVQAIKQLTHPGLFGADVNSGFEVEPGIKNIDKLKNFITELYELPGK